MKTTRIFKSKSNSNKCLTTERSRRWLVPVCCKLKIKSKDKEKKNKQLNSISDGIQSKWSTNGIPSRKFLEEQQDNTRFPFIVFFFVFFLLIVKSNLQCKCETYEVGTGEPSATCFKTILFNRNNTHRKLEGNVTVPVPSHSIPFI